MHQQARQTLRELRSLTNIETYLKTARAELASKPTTKGCAFIPSIEGLLTGKKAKLTDTTGSYIGSHTNDVS